MKVKIVLVGQRIFRNRLLIVKTTIKVVVQQYNLYITSIGKNNLKKCINVTTIEKIFNRKATLVDSFDYNTHTNLILNSCIFLLDNMSAKTNKNTPCGKNTFPPSLSKGVIW